MTDVISENRSRYNVSPQPEEDGSNDRDVAATTG